MIGSSHVVHGYDPYYKEFFKNRRESECYMEYFESILENLAVFSEMDVYGHIDYVVDMVRIRTESILTVDTRISWTRSCERSFPGAVESS